MRCYYTTDGAPLVLAVLDKDKTLGGPRGGTLEPSIYIFEENEQNQALAQSIIADYSRYTVVSGVLHCDGSPVLVAPQTDEPLNRRYHPQSALDEMVAAVEIQDWRAAFAALRDHLMQGSKYNNPLR